MISLVVAPHADDETLGAGGTLFKRKDEGQEIHWIIVTNISVGPDYNKEKVDERKVEIKKISDLYDFTEVFDLGFQPTKLDQIPFDHLVTSISDVVRKCQPTEIFVPHYGDIHSDHRVTFDAVASSVKWFRNRSVKQILAYETLSESEFSLTPQNNFKPNYFVNIEETFHKKIEALEIYKSEIDNFPFPRSKEAVKALAVLRGSNSGFQLSEAFELLRKFE